MGSNEMAETHARSNNGSNMLLVDQTKWWQTHGNVYSTAWMKQTIKWQHTLHLIQHSC